VWRGLKLKSPTEEDTKTGSQRRTHINWKILHHTKGGRGSTRENLRTSEEEGRAGKRQRGESLKCPVKSLFSLSGSESGGKRSEAKVNHTLKKPLLHESRFHSKIYRRDICDERRGVPIGASDTEAGGFTNSSGQGFAESRKKETQRYAVPGGCAGCLHPRF